MDSAGPLGGCCCCASFLGLAIVATCLSILAPTEIALRYNTFYQTVDDKTVDQPGAYFTGWFVSLMKYPRTIQTIEYSKAKGNTLKARTSDGLPLTMEVSFQYALIPEQLHALYFEYEGKQNSYHSIYKLIGTHLLTEMACNYTAYQFFNEKERIADEFLAILNTYYSANLHATIDSLQINEDDLPYLFTNALLEAQIVNTMTTQMVKTKEAKKVEFETAVIVAEAQANVTLQNAAGNSARVLQNGIAEANIIEAYVRAEIGAYGHIHKDLTLNGDELIDYMWYDVLSGGGVSASANANQNLNVFVNVNPSAYISGR